MTGAEVSDAVEWARDDVADDIRSRGFSKPNPHP